MNISIVKQIANSDWDKLVQETYGRPYCFQQQNDCRNRGVYDLSVPRKEDSVYDFKNETVPEKVNGEEMGVSFKAWLERNPKQCLDSTEEWDRTESALILWWERNFYPTEDAIAYDLYKRGLLPAGEYQILVDW